MAQLCFLPSRLFCLFIQVPFFSAKFDEVFSYPGRCGFPLLLIFRDAGSSVSGLISE